MRWIRWIYHHIFPHWTQMRQVGFGHFVCPQIDCQNEVRTDMIQDTITQEKERRFAFVRAVYEQSGGNEFAVFDREVIGDQLGFDPQTVERVVQYLIREGLLFGYLSGEVNITHDGINEVEGALSHPDQPTTHFPPINIISIGTVTNSQLMQGSPSSTQTQSIILSQPQLEEVSTFLQNFRHALPGLNLNDENKREAEAELQTAEAQLSSSRPKLPVLKSALNTLRQLLTHTGAIILAEQIMKYWPGFLS
jgi:hypothetical protein